MLNRQPPRPQILRPVNFTRSQTTKGNRPMSSCVYAIANSDAQAIRIATRLKASGFTPDDISILAPDRSGRRDLGHENTTKAPEGAAAGAGTGAILGGALGWL